MKTRRIVVIGRTDVGRRVCSLLSTSGISVVPGLYFVGAGTHPGAGMPGVLSSAKVVENLLRRAA